MGSTSLFLSRENIKQFAREVGTQIPLASSTYSADAECAGHSRFAVDR